MSQSREDLAALAERVGTIARRLAAAGGQQESSTGASSPAPPGLHAVRIAAELAAVASAALRVSVDHAKAAGRTWQELGAVLGVSRQAAFQRFGHPVDPRTGELMSNAMLPGATDKATQLMIDWIEERYDLVAADFADVMAEKLPVQRLPQAWARLVGLVGNYQGMGEPIARQAGDLTVVDIPMTFEASEMKGRVVYDKDGKVAGLFVLKPDVL